MLLQMVHHHLNINQDNSTAVGNNRVFENVKAAPLKYLSNFWRSL